MSRQRSKLECSHLLAPSPLWSLSKKLCQQKIFGQAYLYSTIMKILPQDKTIRGCQVNFRGGYLSSMGVLIIAKSELATCPCPCPSLHHWWPVLFASEWKVNKTVWNQKTTQLHTKSFFGLFSIRDLSWRSIPYWCQRVPPTVSPSPSTSSIQGELKSVPFIILQFQALFRFSFQQNGVIHTFITFTYLSIILYASLWLRLCQIKPHKWYLGRLEKVEVQT